MATVHLYNLARMTTTTVGTGTMTLGSAVSGFLSFATAGVSDGETVTYAISDGANSEIGRGVYTATGATLTRSVLKSTNGGSAISLSGTAQVFITAAAEDFISKNSAGEISQAISIADTTPSTSPTTGAVIVAGGLGVAEYLHVGTALHVEANAVHAAFQGDALIAAAAADGSNCRLSLDAYANGGSGVSAFSFRKVFGTAAAKGDALPNGTQIGLFGGAGWNSQAYTNNVCRISFNTNEDWRASTTGGTIASTTTGSYIGMDVTIVGSTTLVQRLVLTDSRMTISTTGAATSTSTGALVLSGGGIGVSGAGWFGSTVHVPAATTSIASMNIPSGTAPSSPTPGDLWYDGTNLKFRDGGTTRTITWV